LVLKAQGRGEDHLLWKLLAELAKRRDGVGADKEGQRRHTSKIRRTE
jgi:hypothetical protein